MSIKKKIKSIRLGLKSGIKATDSLLRMIDDAEKAAKCLRDAAAEIKEITPEDEEETK